MPKILNQHRNGQPEGSVYVGRPTEWGNPFMVGVHGSREKVIQLYREWLLEQPRLVEKAKVELAGKDLVCWCAPMRCHAEVLMEIANK